ncbi:hypothetical protein RJ639_012522 [Escallonia herrerae]|uniref:Uncharacterized protein n=1 Tax=Escallonia herrerae TaxID=1293975 RepID=A0AA88VLY0_9ASTE|nr:hypothetical protein RJ639_012522 [Escallonia herrerae]
MAVEDPEFETFYTKNIIDFQDRGYQPLSHLFKRQFSRAVEQRIIPDLHRDTEERRATRFKNGLRYGIRKFLTAVTLDTYGQVLDKAQRVEKDVEDGRTMPPRAARRGTRGGCRGNNVTGVNVEAEAAPTPLTLCKDLMFMVMVIKEKITSSNEKVNCNACKYRPPMYS